jgi:hypothetical protein
MPTSQNPTKIATKWALIYIVTSIIITYAFEFLHTDQTAPARYLAYIPFIAFLLLTQKEYRDQLGGYMTFGEGFSSGFRYAIFSGLLLAVFIYIYLTFLSPEVMEKSMEAQRAKMAEQNLSSEQVDKAISIGKKYGGIFGAFGAAVGSAIIGAIISLIGAAIFKKERSAFDNEPVDTTPTV